MEQGAGMAWMFVLPPFDGGRNFRGMGFVDLVKKGDEFEGGG
jgi:hypothetical protein